MPLPNTKGAKIGRCNICAETRKLTSDHVPPKGTIKFRRMELYSLVDFLGAKPGKTGKSRKFQQGVKFRTICEKCNSEIIGSLYDPALVNFANTVSGYLYSQLTRPIATSFSIDTNSVAKAIAGHILALGVDYFPRGEMGDALAEFVLNPSAKVPPELGIYYWVYPYWNQVSVRGLGFMVYGGAPSLNVSVLKFTPLAFMLTWAASEDFHFPYPNLVEYMNDNIGEKTDIPLDFRIVPPEYYPEMPDDKGVVMHGRDAYLATRAKKS